MFVKLYFTDPCQPVIHGHQVDRSDNILITYEKFPISLDFIYCKRFVDLPWICQWPVFIFHSSFQLPARFEADGVCSKVLFVA